MRSPQTSTATFGVKTLRTLFTQGVLASMLVGGLHPIMAATPVITSATRLEIYYNVENPAEAQFSYKIQAAGATAYEATGLPQNAVLDPATGWINGSRNAPGAYDVVIRASNSDGVATTTLRLAIHPTVVGVVSSQGVFSPGQTFNVTLHYNTNVVVTGSPHLALVIGNAGATAFKDATYVSGSGTNELVFQYAVVASDNDADGVQLLPSAPAGGTIADAFGIVASTSLPVRYFVSGITIKADAKSVAGTATAPTAALANVSARMRVVEGDASRALIIGFVIAGSDSKRVLLRAVGPTLAAFGVAGALADPQLKLYSSAGALIAANDNWAGTETSEAATAVGAFTLAPGARDAAVVMTLQPGAYTLVVAPNGGEGVAMAEVYDADPATTAVGKSAITNLSTRGQVDVDGSALIVGFTVHGTSTRRVMIRGVGPALTAFGVGSALADPALAIYKDAQLLAQNDNWSAAAADVTAAGAATGAFALAANSKDAAIVLALNPGAYTAVVSGGVQSGASLVEVYDVPANG